VYIVNKFCLALHKNIYHNLNLRNPNVNDLPVISSVFLSQRSFIAERMLFIAKPDVT